MSDIDKIRKFWNVSQKDVAYYNRVSPNKSESNWGDEGVQKIIENDIIKYSGTLEGKRILEFGCGVGRLLKHMPKYCERIHGVDIAPNMIEFARENINNIDVVLRLSNGKVLPYANSEFDVIYSIHVLQHIPTREMLLDTLKEICRVLKPGGTAALHFNKKISETDREPGQFAGYRPKLENAISLVKEAGFKIKNQNLKDDGHFFLYLTKD